MRRTTAVTRLSALALAVLLLILLSPSPASASCGISYQDGVSGQDCPSTPPLIASAVLGGAAAATLIVLAVAAFRHGKKSAAQFANLLRAQLPVAATGPPQQGGYDDMAEDTDYIPVSAENGSPRLFKRLFPELTEVNRPRLGQGPEWQRNCQSCVNAVDHTLDGRHASAVPRPPRGFFWPDSVTKTIGGGQPFVGVGGYDAITDQMTKAGDGARGVVWGRRFRQIGSRSVEVEGHVFNVVNRGGRVFYVDGQTGTFARLENFGILNLLRTN